jgi:HK97 gp10 family phage protein
MTGATDALLDVATEVARDEVVAKAMLQVTRPIAAQMGDVLYQKVTRETGATGEAIEAAQVDKDETPGVVVVELGPRKGASRGWKAKYWELGTSRLPARPFMRPTWDEHEAGFSAAVTAALQKVYGQVARRASRRRPS